jgi:hypothetical protein
MPDTKEELKMDDGVPDLIAQRMKMAEVERALCRFPRGAQAVALLAGRLPRAYYSISANS